MKLSPHSLLRFSDAADEMIAVRHPSDVRATFIFASGVCTGMPTDEPTVDVEVALSRDLLREIDEFAVENGYENPSAVVSDALANQ